MKNYEININIANGNTHVYTLFNTTEADALEMAHDLAVEEYQAIEGTNGLLNYEECIEICNGDGERAYEMYLDKIEEWVDYTICEIR